MNYRTLGRSDLSVSEISFGCWTMGGLNWVNGTPNGWADPDEAEVAAGVKVALDAGVNHFDNADAYGNGKAERMLARCLDKLGVQSSKVIIATKVGHFPGTAEHAYEPAHIRHQCEQSLINLKRDCVDLYYFHHGNFGPEDRYLAGAVDMMNRLVQEGKVRWVGLSAYSADDFERLVPAVKPVCLQGPANALNDQFIAPGSRVQKLMDEHGLSFVAFGPLAKGRLLDKYDAAKPPKFEPGDHRRDKPEFSPTALHDLHARLFRIKMRFGPTPEALAAVALNFVLEHPHVGCVIPGFRNAKQAACNVAAAGRRLTPEDLDFIRKVFAET